MAGWRFLTLRLSLSFFFLPFAFAIGFECCRGPLRLEFESGQEDVVSLDEQPDGDSDPDKVEEEEVEVSVFFFFWSLVLG